MAVTATFYDSFLRDVTEGDIDMNSNTFKAMLLTSSYTPNFTTHDNRDDLTNEATGTGYSAGGVTVAVTANLNTTSHQMEYTFADAVWTSSTITARYLAIYKSTGTASADHLVLLVDFGADVSSSAGTYTVSQSSVITFKKV
jgi:hypothetical protein